MSRTINGNLTGAAARINLLDEFLDEKPLGYWAMLEAKDELAEVDPDGWAAWWDSEANPDYMKYADRTALIRQHIAEIHEQREEKDRTDEVSFARQGY